ncbi:ATPase AAA, partial [Clostridium sartagoforme AAU1]
NKRFLNNGRGFLRMKKAFYGVGKVKLVNSIKDDNFKVILPGINTYKKYNYHNIKNYTLEVLKQNMI